ncbi:MAG: thermonuclease family protein [Bradymonadales bacterium]|nr:thermonuclease family protein [Bradymonadales bacterium]
MNPRTPVSALGSLALILLLSALPGTALVACSSGPSDSVSAGSLRDAPADVPPLFDTAAEENGDDTAIPPDSQPDTSPDTTPDRILREGVVGTITVITDGDTVHVTVDGWYHKVRLYGINAPECDKTRQYTADGYQYVCSSDQEPWGYNAAQALADVAEGQQVTVHCGQSPGQPCPLDTFDRYLAFLDGEVGDLSEHMARNGHALTFTRYECDRMATYCEAEFEAIEQELGMWSLGSRAEVLSRMNSGTQEWYEDHDDICYDLMD